MTFLYIEHKQSREISKAVWLPAIWLLYSGSKGLGIYFNINATMEAGSPPDRYFLLTLGIIGIFILQKKSHPWLSTLKKNRPLISIIVYMLISVTWSRVPGISLRRWSKEAIAIIIALLIISEKNYIESFSSAFRKTIYIALPFSLMLIKYFPEYGIQYGISSGELMWVGIAGQKNGLALICCFAIIFLLWFLWRDIPKWKISSTKVRTFIDISMIFLAVYLMMGPRRTFTYSSTSFLVLLIGVLSIFIFKTMVIKKSKINSNLISLILLIIIIIGIFMPFTGKIPIRQVPEIVGRDETLTGRIRIWNALTPYAYKKFVLGYGFGGFWTTSLAKQISISAHNGYLDTILNLGLVGLLFFSFFLISSAKRSSELVVSVWDESILVLSMIFMLSVHNISEATLSYVEAFPTSLIVLSSFLINEKYFLRQNNSRILERGSYGLQ